MRASSINTLTAISVHPYFYRSELDALNGKGCEVFHTLTRSQPDGWKG
ncbi:MAG TPA: hypothetical protein VI703_12005 [Anaerolineales bacterium]|nr:hypothetical protein [Anaerolineales bacterium]